ncbi:uncharacterized [Tachysurus ichikawai]
MTSVSADCSLYITRVSFRLLLTETSGALLGLVYHQIYSIDLRMELGEVQFQFTASLQEFLRTQFLRTQFLRTQFLRTQFLRTQFLRI